MEQEKTPYSKMLSFLKDDNTGVEKLILSTEKIEKLKQRLHQLMMASQPFLKHHYSILDLAHDLEMPAYQLSAFINMIMKQRFNDLINQYRITYCINQLKIGAVTDIKVHKLAAECGYSNRNTFITAFKKFTHQTPQAYLINLKREVKMQN
jgi:AraC-like DNA-binding protein